MCNKLAPQAGSSGDARVHVPEGAFHIISRPTPGLDWPTSIPKCNVQATLTEKEIASPTSPWMATVNRIQTPSTKRLLDCGSNCGWVRGSSTVCHLHCGGNSPPPMPCCVPRKERDGSLEE
jgi:hypothetical protein